MPTPLLIPFEPLRQSHGLRILRLVRGRSRNQIRFELRIRDLVFWDRISDRVLTPQMGTASVHDARIFLMLHDGSLVASNGDVYPDADEMVAIRYPGATYTMTGETGRRDPNACSSLPPDMERLRGMLGITADQNDLADAVPDRAVGDPDVEDML